MRWTPAVAVAALSLAGAAPVPKDAGKAVAYFPTAVGARWVYEGGGGGEEAVEVSAVEKAGDGFVVSRKGVGENRSRYTDTVVSIRGLRQPRDRANDKPEQWVLRCGLRAGESWDTPSGKRTVSGPEDVKVPAGTFPALRVVWEGDGETLTSWYAPGIGEVKRTWTRGGEETVARSLRSFTPGKK